MTDDGSVNFNKFLEFDVVAHFNLAPLFTPDPFLCV